MKILVTGAGGQLGFDVVKEIDKRGLTAISLTHSVCDLTDEKAVTSYFNSNSPDAVIHCAAWTAVDLAEDEENKAAVYAINVTASTILANLCKAADIPMLYISTDYVYNGEGTLPHTESDTCAPLNYYGQTKYLGEESIRSITDKHYIVRISWVFGINGKNFVKTMANLGKTKEKLTVVSDQIGTPTYTVDLARLLVDMVLDNNPNHYGTYNASNEGGFISWYDFTCEIMKQLAETEYISDGEQISNYNKIQVLPVDSSAYPSKATRPSNSRMSKEKLIANGFCPLPHWKDALGRFLKELNELS